MERWRQYVVETADGDREEETTEQTGNKTPIMEQELIEAIGKLKIG